MPHHERFAQLRSLLNMSAWTDVERNAFLTLMRLQQRENAQRLVDQWHPYLQGFARHFTRPLCVCISIKQMEALSRLVPEGPLALVLKQSYGTKVDSTGLIEDILEHPLSARLGTLRLHGHTIGDEGAMRISEATHLKRLTCLGLRSSGMGTAGVEALHQSTTLAHLNELDLSGTPLSDASLNVFHRSDHFKRLAILRLDYVSLDGAGCTALATNKALMTGLRGLHLRGNAIGDMGLKMLTRQKTLSTLETLDVHRNDISLEGLKALANARTIKHLKHLDIGGNALTLYDIECLKGRALTHLKHLELDRSTHYPLSLPTGNVETEYVNGDLVPILPQLGKIKHTFKRLRCLTMCGTALNTRGAWVLAHSPHIHDLERLDLSNTGLSNDGVTFILERVGRLKMQHLKLRENYAITIEGLDPMFEGEPWSALRVLDLCGLTISIERVLCMLHSSHFPVLETLVAPLNLNIQEFDDLKQLYPRLSLICPRFDQENRGINDL